MNPEPVHPADPPAAAQQVSKLPILMGFLAGAVPWLLTCLPGKGYDAISFLLFACFVMPLVAIVIAIIPQTRRFGLGLLLASGLGWLVLGAICSGVLRGI